MALNISLFNDDNKLVPLVISKKPFINTLNTGGRFIQFVINLVTIKKKQVFPKIIASNFREDIIELDKIVEKLSVIFNSILVFFSFSFGLVIIPIIILERI